MKKTKQAFIDWVIKALEQNYGIEVDSDGEIYGDFVGKQFNSNFTIQDLKELVD